MASDYLFAYAFVAAAGWLHAWTGAVAGAGTGGSEAAGAAGAERLRAEAGIAACL